MRQAPSPYFRRNVLWPIQRTQTGWKQGTLMERCTSAVRHLMMTPKGSFLCDPNYGSVFYQFRTQGVNDDDMALMEADLRMGFASYIPDAQLHNLVFDRDEENEKLTVKCVWTLQGATSIMHGEWAVPQETTVSL